jgi:predicted N-acetyltransferase YhbS
MISIELLKNHPDTIPRLVQIWHQTLGSIWSPDVPLVRVEQNYQNHLHESDLPLTFVAFQDNKPVGMCSLRENDGIRPDLKPWLGSLVVDPDYQKRGIARQLMQAIKQKALDLGFETLFLFAFDPTIPDYYARLGWQKIGMDVFRGHSVTVMQTDLVLNPNPGDE